MEKAETERSNQTIKRKAQKNCDMGNWQHEGLAGSRRVRRPESDQRKDDSKEVSDTNEEEEDREEVERKITALQRIVPGGESLGVDKLFEETADYIMALQGQVKAMRVLAGLFESFEKKKKRKLGG